MEQAGAPERAAVVAGVDPVDSLDGCKGPCSAWLGGLPGGVEQDRFGSPHRCSRRCEEAGAVS